MEQNEHHCSVPESPMNEELFHTLNSGRRKDLMLNIKPGCCLCAIVSGLVVLKFEVTEIYYCIHIAVLTIIWLANETPDFGDALSASPAPSYDFYSVGLRLEPTNTFH